MEPVSLAQALTEYRAAGKQGRRYLVEMNNLGKSGLLPVLEPMLEETCRPIPLGHMEIPLRKILGTYATGRSSAFAGNFMPLLDEQTEFAKKWMSLYASAAEDGIREGVTAYEYLGYYYVMEGNKRVSVAHRLGAYSVYGHVMRLIPPEQEQNVENQVFREFLQEGIQTVIREMWFSVPGRLSELRDLRNIAVKAGQGSEDLLEDGYTAFRGAYHKLGCHKSLSEITTGDAYWQYIKIYGFPGDEKEEALAANIRNALPQFRELIASTPEYERSDVSESAQRLPLLSLFNRSTRMDVLFAYAGTPKTRFSAAIHDVGRLVIQRRFPELRVSVVEDLPTDGTAYPILSDALHRRKPTLLLVTDATMGQAALRLSLEQKNSFVMHCHNESIGLLSTYYAKTAEPAFLMGVLAGSLTKNARIGYVRPTPALGGMERDIQAFAQGAKLVRPAASVYFSMPDKTLSQPLRPILKTWGELGVDMFWSPFFPAYYGQRQKSFPGVYAHLCGLDASGAAREQYAAAAWHWDVFYSHFLESVLEGSPDALAVKAGRLHYRLGLAGGVLQVHPMLPALGSRSEQLLAHFAALLAEERISPLDEHMTVETIEV